MFTLFLLFFSHQIYSFTLNFSHFTIRNGKIGQTMIKESFFEDYGFIQLLEKSIIHAVKSRKLNDVKNSNVCLTSTCCFTSNRNDVLRQMVGNEMMKWIFLLHKNSYNDLCVRTYFIPRSIFVCVHFSHEMIRSLFDTEANPVCVKMKISILCVVFFYSIFLFFPHFTLFLFSPSSQLSLSYRSSDDILFHFYRMHKTWTNGQMFMAFVCVCSLKPICLAQTES